MARPSDFIPLVSVHLKYQNLIINNALVQKYALYFHFKQYTFFPDCPGGFSGAGKKQ
jgi:hypothetical protein